MAAVKPSSRIPVFEVEQWMDKYELTPGVLNLAETCAASISIDELVRLNSKKQLAAPPVDYSTVMTYGAIRGSDILRQNIASLYARDINKDRVPDAESVLVHPGAIAANHLVFYSLIEAGDHVITVYPTYQQLYSVPASLGAEVSLWKLKPEEAFVPNVDELERLIRPNTKMIVINNPNNPSGATIPEPILLGILAVSKRHNIILFSDEVYAPLFHGLPAPSDFPRSVFTLATSSTSPDTQYDNVVATGSMSKAWALAGIRIGWTVSPNPIIRQALASARDYTTISVSQIDDQIARYALSDEVRPQLAQRNITLARHNLSLLASFIEGEVGRLVCEWVKPNAGTTAFVKFSSKGQGIVDDVAFCKDLLATTKVMFVPGSLCFGNSEEFKGYVRIGYVCQTDVLVEGLTALENYVKEHLL